MQIVESFFFCEGNWSFLSSRLCLIKSNQAAVQSMLKEVLMGGVLKMEFHVRTASWEDLIGSKTTPWEYLFGTEQHHGKISLGQNSIMGGSLWDRIASHWV